LGRETLTLLVILPIALPGIVTALPLRTAFREILGAELSIWTVVIAHATFCIVVVYNNVTARLRRLGTSLEEVSRDLGADGFTTFRLVTFPMLPGAFFAGGILAFGLSFDEIVVTLFTAPARVTTLPIWIFQNLFRPGTDRERGGGRPGAALDRPDLAVPAPVRGFDGAGPVLNRPWAWPASAARSGRILHGGPPASLDLGRLR